MSRSEIPDGGAVPVSPHSGVPSSPPIDARDGHDPSRLGSRGKEHERLIRYLSGLPDHPPCELPRRKLTAEDDPRLGGIWALGQTLEDRLYHDKWRRLLQLCACILLVAAGAGAWAVVVLCGWLK